MFEIQDPTACLPLTIRELTETKDYGTFLPNDDRLEKAQCGTTPASLCLCIEFAT